jgi:hypothetical protein
VASEVEDRIHRALQSHALERIEHGYRLVHPGQTGVSILRVRPVNEIREGPHVVAIAEVLAEYDKVGLPSFHPMGVQRLNALAVHGAFHLRNGRLRQTAQFSIYSNEPAPHLAAQTILNAFGAQLPLGRSTALATVSAAMLEQQQAHHAMPRQWQNPLDEQSLQTATAMFQQSGLAASNNATAVWAEIPLSGTETALLQVNTGTSHPIAGTGYLATISLPSPQAAANAAEICRRLNALELKQSDFVPRLGAWGLHGSEDVPGYSCFLPHAEPIEGLHMSIMWWLIARAAWFKERYWTPKSGLTLDRIPAGQ